MSFAAVAGLAALIGPACAGPGPSPTLDSNARTVSSRLVFGHSVRGRPLRAVGLGHSGARRTALVVGSIHGDEAEGERIVRRLKQHPYPGLGRIRLWLVRTVNPDGRDAGTRENARGVDLNRGFSVDWRSGEPSGSGYYPGPKPFSEPEARAVRRLVKRIRPDVTVWYHQPWGQVLLPCAGPAPLQKRYAAISGLATKRCRGQGLPGTATRWQNQAVGGTAFVVELPGRALADAAIRRHARAAASVAARGGRRLDLRRGHHRGPVDDARRGLLHARPLRLTDRAGDRERAAGAHQEPHRALPRGDQDRLELP